MASGAFEVWKLVHDEGWCVVQEMERIFSISSMMSTIAENKEVYGDMVAEKTFLKRKQIQVLRNDVANIPRVLECAFFDWVRASQSDKVRSESPWWSVRSRVARLQHAATARRSDSQRTTADKVT